LPADQIVAQWSLLELTPMILLPLLPLLLLLLYVLQEDEVPSDFQDYSLVTLVGVAAHLMHVSDAHEGVLEGGGMPVLCNAQVYYSHACSLVLSQLAVQPLLAVLLMPQQRRRHPLHSTNGSAKIMQQLICANSSCLLLLLLLPQAPLGDNGGLDVLAARYGHDAKALDQVGMV
jgi:hypothetical protein